MPINALDAASLIRKMDRPQDKGIFAVDVVEAYPELAEQYKKLCPVRLNLREMEAKAKQGAYAGADWNDQLTADVKLIAANCIKFNGGEKTEFGLLAVSFEQYALSLLNDAMLKPQRPSKQLGEKRKLGGATAEGHHAAPPRPTVVPNGVAAAAAAVVPVAQPANSPSRLGLKVRVAPTIVRPSEHHLPLKIPLALKKYTVLEYAARGESRCALPPADNITVSVLLSSFLAAVGKSPDGLYPVGIATAVVEAVCGIFDTAFTKCLLYLQERTDANAFLLRCCGAQAMEAAVSWHLYAEPKFLLRLLLHFPHIGSLVAQRTSPAGGELLVGRVVPVVEDLLVFMDANAAQLGLSSKE